MLVPWRVMMRSFTVIRLGARNACDQEARKNQNSATRQLPASLATTVPPTSEKFS